MSYGYLVVNDGIMPDGSVDSSRLTSFRVGLECVQRTPNGTTRFSKNINRMTSHNPIAKAKMMISEYAGCDEASKVRKTVIAISRLRISVSQDEFRFRLPE